MAMKADNAGGVKRVSRTKRKAGVSVTRKADKPIDLNEMAEAAATEAAPSPVSVSAFTSGLGSLGRVRASDVNDFMRQLIMLLEAGTPILRSLHTLALRGEKAPVRSMVADIAHYVESGNTLWQAFERHRAFNSVEISLIKASEATGTLASVLRQLVEYRERREMLKKKVRQALFYPVILVVVCGAVLLFIAKIVLPQFKEVFLKLEAVNIPWYTTAIMDGVEMATSAQAGIIFAGVIIGLVVVYAVLMRSPLWRLRLDYLRLKIPVVGKSIVQKRAVAQFTGTLSMLLKGGLSMLAALDLARAAIYNSRVAQVLQDVRDSVERGEGIEEPLRRNDHVIPGVVIDMLVTGEESGKLDDIAEHVSKVYEEELNIAVSGLGELIQPVLTIIIGGVVMGLFLALFLPLITALDSIMNQGGGGV
ncbi:MAG: type II secretion system protein GspF [Candidatus Hydrogenedentota bacterium]